LGDKAAALTLSGRAMAANPIEKDALTGPRSLEILARVAAQMGEPDRAIAALQRVLSLPYTGPAGIPLTPALLRLDRCSICSEMIRASKNSSLRKRESNPAPIFSS